MWIVKESVKLMIFIISHSIQFINSLIFFLNNNLFILFFIRFPKTNAKYSLKCKNVKWVIDYFNWTLKINSVYNFQIYRILNAPIYVRLSVYSMVIDDWFQSEILWFLELGYTVYNWSSDILVSHVFSSIRL